jgi:ABC-type glycerol-3-phosphate transport system substrate-binding protein
MSRFAPTVVSPKTASDESVCIHPIPFQEEREMSRRIVGFSLTALTVIGLLLAGCAPQTVTVTVPVEKPVQVTVPVTVPVTVAAPKGAVTVLGVWGGSEFEAFAAAVEPFTKETGIGMAFETSREQATVLVTRVQAGNPPDIAILPPARSAGGPGENGRAGPAGKHRGYGPVEEGLRAGLD